MKIYKVIFLYFFIVSLVSCEQRNQEKTTNNLLDDLKEKQASNIDLVNTYFSYFNSNDWNKLASMYADSAEFKDPAMGPQIVRQSNQEIKRKYTEMNAIFSDLRDNIVKIYQSGENHVIVEFIATGTASDGTKFLLPICTIFTIENGQITQDFSYYDNFEE